MRKESYVIAELWHLPDMAKKQRKNRPADPNQLAASVVADAIAASEQIEPTGKVKKKNMAAYALSKLGASKGGKARAAALTSRERMAIAISVKSTRRWLLLAGAIV